MFWYNNNRSGRCKLIEKIDSLIRLLSKKHNLINKEFQPKYYVMNMLYRVYEMLV